MDKAGIEVNTAAWKGSTLCYILIVYYHYITTFPEI